MRSPRTRSRRARARIRLLSARLRRARRRLRYRANEFSALTLFAASSLIGIDLFIELLGLLPLAPTIIPLVILGLALVYGVVRMVRRGKE